MTIDLHEFRGSYLLYRKDGKGMKRPRTGQTGRPPKFRHQDRASAIAEAERLLTLLPQSTFLILQEVGRVKVSPSHVSDEAVAWAREQASEPPGPYLSPERQEAFRQAVLGAGVEPGRADEQSCGDVPIRALRDVPPADVRLCRRGGRS